MRRIPLIPHPVLSAALVLLWLALEARTGAADLVPAVLFGLAVPPLAARLWERAPRLRHWGAVPRLRHWGAVPRLLGRVAADIAAANLHTARLMWTRPAASLRPCFLVVPTGLRDRQAVAALAAIITNTPGTIYVDLDEERWELLVHALDEPDPDRAVARMRDRYEGLLKEIFECSTSP